MPGISVVSERVPIKPSSHGMCTAKCVSRVRWSGKPKAVNAAGAGSVFHIASSAATFIFWCSVERYPDSSPSSTTDSDAASPNEAATVIDRFANCRCRPLSTYHADTPSTKIEATT